MEFGVTFEVWNFKAFFHKEQSFGAPSANSGLPYLCSSLFECIAVLFYRKTKGLINSDDIYVF